ncbi:MAG: alpha/beta fold hydrolase [Caldilineaceae bacterium]
MQQRNRRLLWLHWPRRFRPSQRPPVRHAFSVVTVSDMVRAQVKLIDHLGIDKLLCVAGGSFGGMQVLEWAAHHPAHPRRHPHCHHGPSQPHAHRL